MYATSMGMQTQSCYYLTCTFIWCGSGIVIGSWNIFRKLLCELYGIANVTPLFTIAVIMLFGLLGLPAGQRAQLPCFCNSQATTTVFVLLVGSTTCTMSSLHLSEPRTLTHFDNKFLHCTCKLQSKLIPYSGYYSRGYNFRVIRC